MRALLIVLLSLACQGPPAPPTPAAAPPSVAAVQTGAAVQAAAGFEALAGQRVGLIANHTARVGDRHLADLLHAAPGVTLAALFGPEHGIRGDADAGAAIADGRDARTGVPIYSLYGTTRKPTPAMLEGLDVLAFDIQDIGARFYTYISTMGLAMQAAAEAGLPFVVFDRPNPLGGTHVSGFMLAPEQTSFVGQYAIPIQHGLTVGELARMIQGEALLPGLDALDLQVIPMVGWTRSMLWPETGLPWVATSPNIPDFETALLYPGACFFEGTEGSEGRGTQTPFRLLGSPWADGPALAATLNAYGLPGVRFEATAFTPISIPGMSTSPKLQDVPLQGVRYVITDAGAFRPVATGMYVLHAFYEAAPAEERPAFLKPRWLARLAGTERLHAHLTAQATPDQIVAAWEAEAAAFAERRQPYLLYD